MAYQHSTYPYEGVKGNCDRIREAIAEASTGDHVVLFHGDHGDADFPRWRLHPEGVVLRSSDQKRYSLNGEELLYTCTYRSFINNWEVHPKGIVTVERYHNDGDVRDPTWYHLRLNGKDDLHRARSIDFGKIWPHPAGTLTCPAYRLDGRYYLDGDLLYAGKCDGRHTHPQGVVIAREDKLLLARRDGEEVLCAGLSPNILLYNRWHYDERGLYSWSEDRRMLLDGEQVYECRDHKNTFAFFGDDIVEGSDKLITLNGDRRIFHNEFNCWQKHRYGIMVATKNALTLVVIKPQARFDPDAIVCR